MTGWKTFDSSPRDGSHFLARVVDLVDEYDEDDRLIARAVPTPSVVIAYQTDIFGLMEYPYRGAIYQNRSWTHWHPIPELDAVLRSDFRRAALERG